MSESVRYLVGAALAAGLVLGGCGAKPAADAKKTADAIKGGGATQATSPACALLTHDEAAKALGAAVGDGEVAGPMGTACQWNAKSGDGYLQVQVVPADYWSPPSMAKGYHKLPEVAAEAYAAPEMEGWSAGAKAGEKMIAVSLSQGGSEAAVIEVLKTSLGRLK